MEHTNCFFTFYFRKPRHDNPEEFLTFSCTQSLHTTAIIFHVHVYRYRLFLQMQIDCLFKTRYVQGLATYRIQRRDARFYLVKREIPCIYLLAQLWPLKTGPGGMGF